MILLAAGLATLAGLWAGVRGLGLLIRGLRAADDPRGALWVIRGLRGLIFWICLTCLALGAVLREVWLLVFAGLWLLEEIYETGVLALILRSGGVDPPAPGPIAVRPEGPHGEYGRSPFLNDADLSDGRTRRPLSGPWQSRAACGPARHPSPRGRRPWRRHRPRDVWWPRSAW
jgi:hypothetical protein